MHIIHVICRSTRRSLFDLGIRLTLNADCLKRLLDASLSVALVAVGQRRHWRAFQFRFQVGFRVLRWYPLRVIGREKVKKEKSYRNCGGVSYQTSQQFEFALVGAGHLDSNYGESIPSCRGDALGGDQGCIVCQKRSPINQVNLVTLATPPSSFSGVTFRREAMTVSAIQNTNKFSTWPLIN